MIKSVLSIACYLCCCFRKPEDVFVTNAQETFLTENPGSNTRTIEYLRTVWTELSKLERFKIEARVELEYHKLYTQELKKLEDSFHKGTYASIVAADEIVNSVIGNSLSQRNPLVGCTEPLRRFLQKLRHRVRKMETYLDLYNLDPNLSGVDKNPDLSFDTLFSVHKILWSAAITSCRLAAQVFHSQLVSCKMDRKLLNRSMMAKKAAQAKLFKLRRAQSIANRIFDKVL